MASLPVAAAGTAAFAAGDPVYVNHPKHSWVLGRVGRVFPNTARSSSTMKASTYLYDVVVADKERGVENETVPSVSNWSVELCDESMSNKTVDDLLQLTHLHDATLLRCLFLRYMSDVVYTNIGSIVIAFNPFNYEIPHYKDDQISKYLAESAGYIPEKLLPHSWSQAHNTYVDLRTSRTNQCILISGESGAGKTEATKIVVKYISKLSALSADRKSKAAADDVLKNLLACSPVLESFGNARTVRNDNSSRFGKLMQLKFDQSSLVVLGAFTTKYLLEKSRVVTAAAGERVFHSFYLSAICPTAPSDFGFDYPVEENISLFSGKVIANSEFTSVDDFHEVCASMALLGLDQQTIHQVWSIAAGVVHQCNVAFVSDGGEGSKIKTDAQLSIDSLSQVGKLWGVDAAALVDEYQSTTLIIPSAGGTSVAARKLLSPAKAVDVRDALSKGVYEALFSFLVERCNAKCDVELSQFMWIALLDIFGFEDFELNSFEQLCINLANETLQSHYNEFIFSKDMDTCRAEGINTVDIMCPDNKPCVDMIAGNRSILVALDDQCSLGKGSDAAFLDGIVNDFNGRHPFFAKKKLSRNAFVVKHYAGDVEYDVTNWLEKNRDTLKDSLRDLCRGSKVPLMSQIMQMQAAAVAQHAGSGGSKAITVGLVFRRQLQQLMAVIESTNPHWIRCIKPHPAKKPRQFSGPSTMAQLESSGVLGTVKIRKAGYPVRFQHALFVARYIPIVPLATGQRAASLSVADAAIHCAKVLSVAELSDAKMTQIGKTITFLKSEAYMTIEKKRVGYVKMRVLLLQRIGRACRSRRRLFYLGRALTWQRAGRGCIARSRLFVAYCEYHRARLLAERRRREELQAIEEKRLATLRALFLEASQAIFLEESRERAPLAAQLLAELDRYGADGHDEIVSLMQEEKERALSERRRAEEQERRRRTEAERRRWAELIEVFLKQAQLLAFDLGLEEDTERKLLLRSCGLGMVRLRTLAAARGLSYEETSARHTIEVELTEAFHRLESTAEVVNRTAKMRIAEEKLNRSLEFNRRVRAAKEVARRERAAHAPRSDVEMLLVDASPSRRDDASEIGTGIGSGEGEVECSPMVAASRAADDDGASAWNTRPAALLTRGSSSPRARGMNDDRLTAMDGHEPSGPVWSSPSATRRDGSRSSQHNHRVVMDPAELVRRLDDLERRQLASVVKTPQQLMAFPTSPSGAISRLRSVETGQRVYCPRLGKSGTVVGVPSLPSVSLSKAFLVHFDRPHEEEVWLEPDDVCIRVGIDDRSAPPSHRSTRLASGNERQGVRHAATSGSTSPPRSAATSGRGGASRARSKSPTALQSSAALSAAAFSQWRRQLDEAGW